MIMTSNIGADLIKKRGSLGFKIEKENLTYDDMKSKLNEEIKKTFKPEFLNRIDDVIVFHALSREDLGKIVDIEVNEVKERLKEQDINIELTKDAKEFLIEKGFDVVFGARPLKRTIARFLEDPLAQSLLKGEIDKTKLTIVKYKNDRLIFESKSK
jgi:ATP-dependent Clp protease ATP-binding subunit ClpC